MRSLDVDLSKIGKVALAYGKAGVGKTFSFGTAPQPIQVINSEPRDPRQVLQDFIRSGVKIDCVSPETNQFGEFLEFIGEQERLASKNKYPYNTICLDGASFLQTNTLYHNLQDSAATERDVSASQEKNEIQRILKAPKLHDLGEIGFGGWNTMGSHPQRLFGLINSMSSYGINVIVTAWVGENPVRSAEDDEVPMFSGKYVYQGLMGYFDFVGRVFSSPIGFPPIIAFRHLTSEESQSLLGRPKPPTFMAKAANSRLQQAAIQRLNWTDIFNLIDGKV